MKSIKGLGLPQSTAVPVSWKSELPFRITLVLYAFWERQWFLGHSVFASVTDVFSLLLTCTANVLPPGDGMFVIPKYQLNQWKFKQGYK